MFRCRTPGRHCRCLLYTSPSGPGPIPAPAQAPAAQGSGAQAPAVTGQPAHQDQEAPTIKVQANEVDLVFTVTDKKGKFVTGLKQSSFGLLDNRMPPEAVLGFFQQTDLPLRVGIMLDTSSSIRERFAFEQDSAITFLLQVLHKNDRAFVEGFDVETDVAQGFTNNIDPVSYTHLGQRRRSVREEYRATRGVEAAPEPLVPELDLDEDTDVEDGVRTFVADAAAAGMRLDAYLAKAIPEISRARVQLLIEAGQVRVAGESAKAKQKLRGGEAIEIEGEPRPAPLHAMAEDIPLDILYEDKYLAVVNKSAGMMVHAGAGADGARNRGTLVNALLHHMAKQTSTLSGVGGELRPGIVHRLDKQTSGAIVVAKDDVTHRKLGEMFATRRVAKTYLALVHGNLAKDQITVNCLLYTSRCV